MPWLRALMQQLVVRSVNGKWCCGPALPRPVKQPYGRFAAGGVWSGRRGWAGRKYCNLLLARLPSSAFWPPLPPYLCSTWTCSATCWCGCWRRSRLPRHNTPWSPPLAAPEPADTLQASSHFASPLVQYQDAGPTAQCAICQPLTNCALLCFPLLSLQYLDLQRNLLVRLPVGLAALSRLADLDLSSNSLRRLPPDFGQLTG